MKRILHVVTNVAHYDDPTHPTHPTGLWLSELTHAWDIFAAEGHEQHLVSPQGGRSPLEPRALKWPLLDASARPGGTIRPAWRSWSKPSPRTGSTSRIMTRSISLAGMV